ncbi:hypothetical protein [Mastigocladopsis repens]|uniref:hypothetical protein n=1 Tax=Mastigocladopsis repens TaxID=221287 RepID=UPI00031CAC6C|nr:hypothetical protein [Mastigocladopsis repens]
MRTATLPRFSKHQLVSFFGGIGKIQNYQLDSGMWAYAVEMEMGPLPEMGRVGSETTILLYEAEIQDVMDL